MLAFAWVVARGGIQLPVAGEIRLGLGGGDAGQGEEKESDLDQISDRISILVVSREREGHGLAS